MLKKCEYSDKKYSLLILFYIQKYKIVMTPAADRNSTYGTPFLGYSFSRLNQRWYSIFRLEQRCNSIPRLYQRCQAFLGLIGDVTAFPKLDQILILYIPGLDQRCNNIPRLDKRWNSFPRLDKRWNSSPGLDKG
jgi:hypothetical protein